MPDATVRFTEPNDFGNLKPEDDPTTIEGLKPGDFGYWDAFGRWNDKRNKEREAERAALKAEETK